MGDFKVVEKFRLSLVNHDGQSERVIVQIGLDGLKVLGLDGKKTLRSYDLSHISRWQCRGSSLVLYTKTPVDVEERQVTLQGDDQTVRSALDTLTCCCMQLCEILQSKKSDNDKETANNLHALVQGGGKKKTALLSADDIEYWIAPEKQGWLLCQGEQLKMWRKRWFVLKQGHLFRFLNSTVVEATKPRGVVDLSKVQDVKEARNVTGRANSFLLKTSTGASVSYVTETETELVEWMSAIESAMQKIAKMVAGVEDEPAVKGAKPRAQTTHNDWAKQLERNFENMSTNSKDKPRQDQPSGGPTMINVIGYESIAGGRSSPPRSTYGNQYNSSLASARSGGGISYEQISGIAGVVSGGSPYGDDLLLNYGSSSDPSRVQPTYGSSNIQSVQQHDYYSSYQQPSRPFEQPSYQQPTQQSYEQFVQPSSSGYNPQSSFGQGQASYNPPAQSNYGQAHRQPSLQTTGSVSLLDMVPQQQPAYPYFQHAPASQPVAPQPVPSPVTPMASIWQVHHTPEGRPYYYNSSTGITQWERPLGLAA